MHALVHLSHLPPHSQGLTGMIASTALCAVASRP